MGQPLDGWMALMAESPATTKDKPFFDKHRPKAPMPETPTKRHEEIEPIEPNEGTNREFGGMFQGEVHEERAQTVV